MEATDLTFAHVSLVERDTYDRLVDLIKEGYDSNAFAPYPVPEDEKERLEVLEKYRARASDYLDSLVAQAAEEFGVDKASIHLVERKKNTFVACHGFDADEVARADTICTHTITDQDVLVVEHVQDDPRFAAIDVYEEMDINWYAGTVLRISGQNVGTFCLQDSEQHDFTEEDKERLKDYAVKAASLIALQKSFNDTQTNTVKDAIDLTRQKIETDG